MYQFQSHIRYSELNRNKFLDIGSLLDYFQDCSTFHSESLDRGMEYLESIHRAWLLNYWQVVFNRFPSLDEKVTISTWPYGFDRLFGYRNFLMQDEKENVLAYANTTWFYMDVLNNHPIRTEEKVLSAYSVEEKYEMNYEPRKINVPDNMDTIDSFTVKSGYIDTNQHVNNTSYIKMSLDYLPDDLKPIQLRASYQNSALLGDTIIVKTKTLYNNYYILLCDKEGSPYTIVEYRFDFL